MINFVLSLRRLLRITEEKIPFHIPALALSACLTGICIVSYAPVPGFRGLLYPTVLVCILYLVGIVGREDIQWLKGLIYQK